MNFLILRGSTSLILHATFEGCDTDLIPLMFCKHNESDEKGTTPTQINAFQLIGMSSSLDLSGFFEKEVTCCLLITELTNV